MFQGKVAIITGASSGIGKALAYELAHHGAKLVIAARNLEELSQIAQDLNNKGTEVLPVRTDVTQETDCKQLIEKAYHHFGQIDILINNAGISMRAILEELDTSVLHRVMDVNFWGTVHFLCGSGNPCRFALPESWGFVCDRIDFSGGDNGQDEGFDFC